MHKSLPLTMATNLTSKSMMVCLEQWEWTQRSLVPSTAARERSITSLHVRWVSFSLPMTTRPFTSSKSWWVVRGKCYATLRSDTSISHSKCLMSKLIIGLELLIWLTTILTIFLCIIGMMDSESKRSGSFWTTKLIKYINTCQSLALSYPKYLSNGSLMNVQPS